MNARAAETNSDLKAALTLPWKKNLSEPRNLVEGGLQLDQDLAAEVTRHLQWEAKLPELCEAAVNEVQAQCEPPSFHLPFWVVPITGVVGFAFGFYLGVSHS